jgi:hypothetical protein
VCRDCADKLRKEVPLASPTEEIVETPVAKTTATPVEKKVVTPAAPAQAEPSKETMPAPVPEYKPTVISEPASQSPASQPLPATAPSEKKEPILSMFLSVIVPGLGQIYNKQVQKGIILLVGYVLLWLVVVVLRSRSSLLCCLTFWLPLVIMLYAAYDAYATTKKINEGQAVKDWMS